jgi:hypothetical protein
VKSDLLAEAGSAGLLALEGRGGLLRHREEPHVCATDGLPPVAARGGEERGEAVVVVAERSGVERGGREGSGRVVTMATRPWRYCSAG